MTAARQCRHVWVDCIGGSRRPGLVIAWRRSTTGTWEAQVAIAQPSSVLLTCDLVDRPAPCHRRPLDQRPRRRTRQL